ncbi:MAG: UDP-N-acetylmuramyl pentapeptide phosphotransferase/UDP-N-acetylglucosamine-phosphate transferase [Acidimicrobiales bacterium]|nr:UDP-N-acetylmuramyl pentapeptide phosphotransferase/UDP-N-acetylglucosamine-phosphate transferase [Acidimicrobiales bacterium]
MRVLVGLLAGLLAGSVLLVFLRPVLAHPVLQRENYRKHRLPTAGGLVAVVAVLAVEGVWALIDSRGVHHVYVLITLAFGALGFVDDVLGTGSDGRGFVGHVRALLHGRLTTGGLKLFGGGAAALIACAAVDGGRVDLLVDAALVALAANLANLFDRAPGRCLKMGGLCFVLLAAAAGLDSNLAGVAVAMGALLTLLPADLGERLMIGDTGANAVGAVLALGLVLVVPFWGRLLALVVVLGLNLLSEAVSFSSIIDRAAPLRWVDRAGRSSGYPEVP